MKWERLYEGIMIFSRARSEAIDLSFIYGNKHRVIKEKIMCECDKTGVLETGDKDNLIKKKVNCRTFRLICDQEDYVKWESEVKNRIDKIEK